MGAAGSDGPAAPSFPATPAADPPPSGRAADVPFRTRYRVPILVLQIAVTVGILVGAALIWGPGPFVAATRVLSWPAVAAALLLGGAGVLLQARRWQVIARGQGLVLGFGEAVTRCWQAAFLNAILPGGLAGDAVRAVEQSPRADHTVGGTLRRSVGAVSAERLAGTAVVFLAAGVALLGPRPAAGALALAVAVAAAAVATGWLRRLGAAQLGLVVLLALAGWAVFAALFGVGLRTVAPAVPPAEIPTLAAITLAGMSVPLNVAGWGPREGAAAFGFMVLGHPPGQGVAVSVAYGLLALVSVLPGGLILVARTLNRTRRRPLPRPSDHPRSRPARRAAQERP